MTDYRYPIVGAFYRPPALGLLKCLPHGTELCVVAEPDNAYDQYAVAVWVPATELEQLPLESDPELMNYGTTRRQLIDAARDIHLGYVPKALAKILRTQGIVQVGEKITASYLINGAGQPRVFWSEDEDLPTPEYDPAPDID